MSRNGARPAELGSAPRRYPIHIDPSLASKVTNKVRDPTTTLAGIHLGCFRQSTATRAACKLERDAKPWKLRPCESFCKCFYCHHYERAWFLEAFFRYVSLSGPFLRRIAATPRLGRGNSVETSRDGAAAGTWRFRGDES